MATAAKLTSSDVQFSRLVYEPPDVVRKQGDAFRLRREVEAIGYVKSRTCIPTPDIVEVHLSPDESEEPSWIRMKQLPGRQLGEVWDTMSQELQGRTISQLKSLLNELHSITPPSEPGWIGSCSQGPAYDHRLDNMAMVGPFASLGDFHDFLVAPVKECPRPEWVSKYRSLLPDSHGIMFSHADISWENILVDPATGNVTGILDWEMAGFWPAWWEYRKALFGARNQPWWIEIVKEIMAEYPIETDADMELEMF